ncbi:MAG: hypothetical protein SPE98_02770 [Bacteroidaceae bacterium]|nr:hypothetical protein [Paraprevotella sp.]MDY3891667.1 hypothetical protein [Bacteroidaceae bacterium]MDY5077302.1 hypothetical protein [Bacteroidaceae bacterium]
MGELKTAVEKKVKGEAKMMRKANEAFTAENFLSCGPVADGGSRVMQASGKRKEFTLQRCAFLMEVLVYAMFSC